MNDKYGAEAQQIETKGEMIAATIGIISIILIVVFLAVAKINEKDVCDPEHPDYSFFASEGACDYP